MFASAVAAVAATSPPNKVMLFEGFMEKYHKKYDSEFDKGQRFQIFSENVDKIYESNAKNKSYTLGITANADRTFEEWRSEYLTGFKPALTAEKKDRPIFQAPVSFTPPDSIDWVKKGGVTEVKNQGTCGSCWTFSTVGALEGAMHVAGRKMVDLSMQHILACDKGGHACGGGSMDQAFSWVEENGVPSLADEPYLCQDANSAQCKNMQCDACSKQTGESCWFGTCKKVEGSVCNKAGLFHHCECPDDQCFSDGKCGAPAKKPSLVLEVGDVVKYTDVAPTENALEAAVAQQPVSVAIEADQMVFQHYTSGVLTNDACGSNLDHGVLAVGYGVDNGQKYWKVKNSWGTVFGEDGYIRIEKGDAANGGECGIRKLASFPTVKTSASSIVV
jgi:C1A family cysteine protease